MQTTYPYITNYSIVPVTVSYAKSAGGAAHNVSLYFISVPLLYIKKESNGTVYERVEGYLYFNMFNNTDIFGADKYREAVKTYFTQYENIRAADDAVQAIAACPLLTSGDMFVSENIYNVLTENGVNIADTVSIKDENTITDISELTNDELYSKDILHFIYINKARVAALPETSNTYTDSELDAFASTFFNIIKQYSEGKDTGLDTVTGKIYNSVIDYYINSKVDAAVSLIDAVLGSVYSYYSATKTTAGCGCSSPHGDSSLSAPCLSQYHTAMTTWTVQMMTDIDAFYNKYFYKEVTDEETGGICYAADTDLIDSLVLLIDEFKTLGHDLSFSTDISKFSVCNCRTSGASSVASDCNYAVLDNFKSLLLYIKNNEAGGSENKIKSYGAAFANIVGRMYF